MLITVKIYSSYKLTYSNIYLKVLKKIYGEQIELDNVKLEIEDISDNGTRNIQQQRSLSSFVSRTIRIYEDSKLKHIVGISNTNYDLDKRNEILLGDCKNRKDNYGKNNYHANTYLKQGAAAIFNYYYEEKKINKDVNLTFYLLDIKETYPHNLYNVLSYRELETIGFRILNLEEIKFEEYTKACGSKISYKAIGFPSINKYIRDIAYISKKNSGNTPSFLQCEEQEEFKEDGTTAYLTEKYVYTFKSLSAQGYDSLFRCWCLKKLAEKENQTIEFRLGKQYFAYNEKDMKIAEELTGPIKATFEYADIVVNYVTNDEFMKYIKEADETYLRFKSTKELRNQVLFRNNLRKKGIPIECVLCGEDNDAILEAAHFWEVNKIKSSSDVEINNFIKLNNLFDLIDCHSKYKNEVTFKKYSLVNSGENGVWLCKNHHGLFDKNFYCFESENGKLLLHFNDNKDAIAFLSAIKNEENFRLAESILTHPTKSFIAQRQIYFP